MTAETKAIITLDKYNEKREELKALYAERFDEANTPESMLNLNMWHTEESNKLEIWFINELKAIFKGV